MATSSKNLTALYLTTAIAITWQVLPGTANAYESSTSDSFQRVTFGNNFVDAAEFGDLPTLKFLLESGENPNQKGDFETTALLRATYKGNFEAVKLLLENGANPNMSDIGGATPLHIASREGNQQIVELLMKSGANINISDKEGFTPLMRASIAGDDKILKGLVKLGASAEIKNEFGETAITQAAKSKNNSAVTILMAQEEKLQLDTNEQINIAAADAAKQAAQMAELVPASGTSSWSQAVSNELFGTEFMLMAIADVKSANPSGTFNLLDFGSFETEADARKKLDELKTKHADILKGLNILVVEKTAGDNTKYHINAGMVDSKEEAVTKCKALIAKNVICRPTETKMMLAAKPEPVVQTTAEPAPAAEVSKTELTAPVKTKTAKTDAKTEVKPAEVKVAAVEPKVEVKAAEIKPEVKPEVKTSENIGKFNLDKKDDEKEEDSFFSSLLSSEPETKLPEPKLPEVKAPTKTEIKPEVEVVAEKLAEPKPAEVKVAAPKIDNPLLQPTTKTEVAKAAEVKSEIKTELKSVVEKLAEPKSAEVKITAPKIDNPLLQATTKAEVKAPIVTEKKIEIAKAPEIKPIVLIEPKTDEAKLEVKTEVIKEETIILPPLPKLDAVKESKVSIAESNAKPAETKPIETVILEAKPVKQKPMATEIAKTEVKAPEVKAEPKSLPPLIAFNNDKVEATELAGSKPVIEQIEKPEPVTTAETIPPAKVEIRAELTEVPSYNALPSSPPKLVAPKLDAPRVEVPKFEPPKLVAEPTVTAAKQELPEIEAEPVIATPQAKMLDNAANNYLAGKPSLVVKGKTPTYTAPTPPQTSYIAPTQTVTTNTAAPIASAQVPVYTQAPAQNYVAPTYVSPSQVVVKSSAAPVPQQVQPQPQSYTPAPVIAPANVPSPLVAPLQTYAAPAQTFIAPTQQVANTSELWVNIGFFNNQSTARGFWNRMSASADPIFTKYRMKTKRSIGQSSKVSADIGPIFNTADATDLCNRISAEGLSCMISQPLASKQQYSANRNNFAGGRHSNIQSDAFNYNVVGDEIGSYGYNNWAIQLGTYDSMSVANNVWENLKVQHRILSDMEHKVSRPDNGNGKLRLRAGNFTSAEAAENTCAELRRNFVSCIIVRNS